MSLEELKRVTVAHDSNAPSDWCSYEGLKIQLDGVREKQKQEYESQENVIDELRKKIQQVEEENGQKSDLMQKAENIEGELKKKQRALEEAQTSETSLKEETEKLRQQLKTTEARLAEVSNFCGDSNM